MVRMHKKETICLLLILISLIGGAVFVRVRHGGIFSQSASVEDAFSPESSNKNVVEVVPVPVAGETIAPSVASENLKTYTHPNPKFSVDFPGEMNVETYDEGGESETILFRGPSGSFQVFVSAYDGDDSLSVDDIRRLQPFTEVTEPQTIQVGGVQAILFFSTVADIGKTREVWMAKGKYLFSITTHADHDAWLAHIMTTWRF